MKNWRDFFKNKKITMLGLGVLGRGIGVAKFLSRHGARLLITDLKNEEQLKTALKELKCCKNIKYVLGRHRLEDFRDCDMVIKSAGVPLDSPFVKEARKNKIPVEMDASLFARFSPATIIGITGTRGKSTVTHLLYEILKSAGKRVFLGGNVRGLATLPLLEKAKHSDYVVLELDSWQLQGFGDAKMNPHIAVFTTFLDDHLNYYLSTPSTKLGTSSLEASRKKYFADKANIFKYQKKGDLLVVGKQAKPFIKKYGVKVKSKITVPPETLPKGWEFPLPGKHNEYNARLAVEVARSLRVPDSVIRRSLALFRAVPGRLELIREIRGVKIYNDTNSTTPDATSVALKALGKRKNISLIMGGADKNLKAGALTKEIKKYCKYVALLKGSGTEKVKAKINGKEFGDFKRAVSSAFKKTKKGDILLLSPAFASFGMFKNEYDRGEQFVRLVKKLK